MKTLENYPIVELKLIYHLLSAQVPLHPELIESELLRDIQSCLLHQAMIEGIEVSTHEAWTEWLIRK
ncbi:MAG: hypothetical protein BWK79_13690 [Beggiatoa sp. IS2]|nr:MAG: hypothetical protein BWK79_13690 [Beggiatoa sp. IS2]